jgi:hypothetical protein
MQDPITLDDFTKIARQLADQRLRSADVPPGQWSLDVLATVAVKSASWWQQGKSPSDLVDHVMLLPQAQLTGSTFRLPGH